MMNEFPSYGLEVDHPIFIRARIQSRHMNRTKYYLYILAEKNGEGNRSIKAYYCTCKNGARTVGCCAHIMTVIWYLGYARHSDERIKAPSEDKEHIFISYITSDEET